MRNGKERGNQGNKKGRQEIGKEKEGNEEDDREKE